MREAAGWLVALAIALATFASVASSPRATLLFTDGDSLIVALLSRSITAGGPQDWAMSSVLFLPEVAGFTALAALLPIGVNGVLAVNGVLNLVGLYGAVRLAAGRRLPGTAPVAWSLIAVAVFGLIAATDASASRDALELASLMLTTTYYSATVIAAVATVGLVRRTLDRAAARPLPLTAMVVVAAVSTLTNPLYAVWAGVPVLLLLAVAALPSLRSVRLRVIATPAAVILIGVVFGFALRIPFSEWIEKSGLGYAQPERWMQSAGYYGQLLADRLSTPPGRLWLALTLGMLALALVHTVRRADAGAAAPADGSQFVAASAWVMPLLVMVGAIALGTHAARYLQPLAFAPMLALVAAPRALPLPTPARHAAIAVVAAAAVIVTAVSVPRVAAVAQHSDADLTCVTDWVAASGRTGAGQFWTARLPKLHLDDPSRLVQVDHQLNAYAWLVNRTDFGVGEVSFLLEDSSTVGWELPVPAIPDDIVECGRYRILDFGEQTLPLGPPHS